MLHSVSNGILVIACLCFGAGLACIGIYAGGRQLGRHVSEKRFSAGCLLLSAAAAGIVYSLIFSSDRLHSAFSSLPYGLYCLFFIIIGICAGVWYRVFLPAALICYISYAMIVSVFLYKTFYAPDTEFRVDVEDAAVVITDVPYPAAGDTRVIAVDTVRIPQELLLPVPAVWISGVSAADTADEAGGACRALFDAGLVPGILQPVLRKYNDFLCSEREPVVLAVPRHEFLPVRYTLKCAYAHASFSCELIRSL